MEFVFNARFYFSVKHHVITEERFDPINGFQEVNSIDDTILLLNSHVGEIRMIATVFNPDKPHMQNDEEGDYVIFRTKDVYTANVTSIKLDGRMAYVQTSSKTTYCILLG